MPLQNFSEHYPRLVKQLLTAKETGRVSHAYLLTGDNFERLEKFMNAWIKVNICQQTTLDGDACDECRHCQQVDSGSYPYMKIIKPQSKSRIIVKDQIYELEHFLHLTSEGNRKIAVILDADRMNLESQNAFLKTLEEPSKGSMILQLTLNPSLLLNTIRSRCQRISLLDNHYQYKQDELGDLVNLLAPMKRFAGSVTASKSAQGIIDLLAQIKAKSDEEAKARLKSVKSESQMLQVEARKQLESEAEALMASEYRAKRAEFLSAMHTWFAQDMMLAKGIEAKSVPNPEFYEHVPDYLTTFSLNEAESMRSLNLTEKVIETLNFNVDEKLAIEDFCQSICLKQ